MAFREKSAWISLLSMLAVYGYYFWTEWQRGPGAPELGLLAGCVVLLTVLQIVLHILAAVAAPKEAKVPADEREKLFAVKGYRSAYFVLASGALATIGAALMGYGAAALVNGLFFALVVAEMARVTTLIVHYRRDA